MKIAIYYNLAYGGAKRSVQSHVKGLKELGHAVDVFTHDNQKDEFSPGRFAGTEYLYPFAVTKIPLPIIGRVVQDFQVFYKLKQLHKKIAAEIDAKSYDIVLVHTDTFTQSPFILRFLTSRNVYYCLEPLRIVYEYSLRPSQYLGLFNKLYENITRSIRKTIDRKNARSAMETLTLSLFGREYMIHAYNLYPRISYLGVDETLFKPQRTKKKNQVLFVAEPEYIYGYDLAKEALELIPEDIRPELKMVFGTKKSRRISDAELVESYNESLVTLSLSRYDTFGLVPLESMSCGTPVIALNVAGYRETMRNRKTGYLVEFDPQEIAKRIIYLINHPDRAAQLGENGRKWVEESWTWKKQIPQLEKLLMKAANIPYIELTNPSSDEDDMEL